VFLSSGFRWSGVRAASPDRWLEAPNPLRRFAPDPVRQAGINFPRTRLT
jgi:hypothetical protein